MPLQIKSTNTRARGLQKNYNYKSWLGSVLNNPEPSLDYFKFTDTFKGNQSVTNCHYKIYYNYQMTKLRNDVKTEFREKYAMYWEQRDESDMQRALKIQNQRTIKRLNQITNNEIAHNLDSVSNETSGKSGEEIVLKVMLKVVLRLHYGKRQISHLTTVIEIPIDKFDAIIEASHMDPVLMSPYASGLSNAFDKAPLSTRALHETLYDVVYHKDFDLVAQDDADFMEITIRLDIMSFPNSLLNKIMLEKTAASYLIIYLANQLFIVNNDVGKKSISTGLIEFSGGINDKSSSRKNSKDIEKLYSNMIKVMKNAKTNRMFCMRCYGHYIYFEKFFIFDDTMYKRIDATMEISNTPRKLKAFIKEIPSILAWKEAVISHDLNLN
ncbi:hypothetical protein BCV71DRAFT_272711 [Rhizopus microsporus]|uniref:Uncharacterized protein n=1 Tax=Rhizopus microsporus TaxID=58291 RepID=A0A1X0RVU7_RHIZD|nr:hypothetical protein BCV71DRAFT_272711 [Rhizopus microsporus]